MVEKPTTEQLLKLALKEANETIELQRQQIVSLDNQLIDAKKEIHKLNNNQNK